MKIQNPNIENVERIATALGALRDQVILVGGCACGLLLSDTAAPPARVTYDVDLVAQVIGLNGYHQLKKQFSKLGFKRDSMSPDAPICRWLLGAVEVDLMPSDPTILGFSNPWYPLAIQTAQLHTLPNGISLRVIAAPAFMATKFAAFAGRGRGDFMASHDLEDIINLVDGRVELADEIAQSAIELRTYLVEQCKALLSTPAFLDALPGLIAPDAFQDAQVAKVTLRLKHIASLL